MHGRGTLDFGYSSREQVLLVLILRSSPSPGVGVGERTSQRVNVETPVQSAAKTVESGTRIISIGRDRFRKEERWMGGGGGCGEGGGSRGN